MYPQKCSSEAHQNDIVILLNLLHQLLEPLLELTTVLGAGHKQSHVECDHLPPDQYSVISIHRAAANHIQLRQTQILSLRCSVRRK